MRLPDRPNLDHLKKQAKDLLAQYRRGDPDAMARLRAALPAAAGKDDAAIARQQLRLHDAQSCIAREYDFASWADLRTFVAARAARPADRDAPLLAWLRLVYGGDISGGENRERPQVAARMLADAPTLLGDDPALACAVGDDAPIRRAAARDPTWVNAPGGPLTLPPLVAVTHSSLVRLPEFRDRLHACARLLLALGADPDQSVGNRWPPASLATPSELDMLSALYGAAGRNYDPVLTKLLLDAGATPNDGESLYHALESRECTRLLLEAGAKVTGSNALYRVLDLDDVEALRLLLTHDADPNERPTSQPTSDWGSPLLWAIRRRRSPAHIAALLEAGADAQAKTPDGASAYVLALRFALPEVAALLSTGASDLPDAEQFIAACAAGDDARARSVQARRPDLPGALSPTQLRLLPELAAQGCNAAVMTMVRLGWPITTTGGDWHASALNHAIFRGDATLTRFLLEHGARWTEKHGFGDDASGTLSWASQNQPVADGDWLGCAAALVAHGMPKAEPDAQSADSVLVAGRRKWFSDEVREFLLGNA
jgi:ankyrin repeat protein